MDILSRLFDEMHLQQVQYISVHASGEWQLAQSKQDYLTFIVVRSGKLVLNYANSYQTISANNMVMLTSQQPYCCQPRETLSKAAAVTSMPPHTEGQMKLQINQVKADKESKDNQDKDRKVVKFIVVRSRFDVDMARPLLSSLPLSLPPPTQQHSAYNEVVRIGLQFFQLEVSLQRPGKTTMLERLASMLMIECIREYVEQLKTASTTHLRDNSGELSDNKAAKREGLLWQQSAWQIYKTTNGELLQTSKNEENNNNGALRGTNINSISDNGNWLAALKDPYLAKTLYLMHSYPGESWTLQDLAKESGLSRSSLSERFKQLIGITPQAYFSHYRLRLAARYLRQEQYSISKISELVGYASDHSFSGAFKRRYGHSPSHYRKAFMEQK